MIYDVIFRGGVLAKLHFYYSAMNAGKSTTLLQSDYNYNERGMDTLLYSPVVDNRSGVRTSSSRIGLESPAVGFMSDTDILADVSSKIALNSNIKCILVDEAQFLLKQQVLQLCRIVDYHNLPVLAYGLRTDFQGEPFEGSLYLLAWADSLVELKTICHCGRKATMNVRIDASGAPISQGEQVQIGGNESYVSMCRRHFQEATGQKIINQGQIREEA